jgi:hypothetical protein
MQSRFPGWVIAAMVLSGCGGTTGSTVAPRPSDAQAFVRVENQSWTDFSIFVVWEGARQRLGRSPASTTAAFPIPDRYLGEGRGGWVQFLVDPVGPPGGPLSRRLRVFPGDTVHIIIPPG